MPVNAVARIVGEYDTRLWRLLQAYVNEAYQEADFSSVRVVGCDELSARKGHNYLSVFADLEAKRVLYVTEGKDPLLGIVSLRNCHNTGLRPIR
jgi:transposase